MDTPSIVPPHDDGQPPPSDTKPPIDKWSHSSLRMLSECPRHFQLAKLTDHPGIETPEFTFGRELHDAIRKYSKLCRDNGLEQSNAHAGAVVSDITDGNGQKQFLRFVERTYFQWHDVLADEKMESWHEMELPNGAGTFRGRYDWCQITAEDEGTVRDYKSGYAQGFSPPHPTAQLRQYGVTLLAENPGLRIVRLEQEFIGGGEIWPAYNPEPIVWQVLRADIAPMVDSIMDDISLATGHLREHGEEDWPLDPGGHCSMCGHRYMCPAAAPLWSEVLSPDCHKLRLSPDTPIQDVVDADDYLGAQKKQVRALMRAHHEKHGAFVDNNGRTWDRMGADTKLALKDTITNDGVAIDGLLAFAVACVEAGKDPSRYVNPKSADLAKLTDHPTLKRYLKTVPASKTFRSKKGG